MGSSLHPNAGAAQIGAYPPVGSTVERLGRSGRRWLQEARRLPLLPLLILLIVLVIPALFAERIAPHDPIQGRLADRLIPPAWMQGGTWNFPLGTDRQGRDILTRILYGARISFGVSLSAIAIGGGIGVTLGLIAGYFGGWIEQVIMYLVDTFLSLPLILMALTIVAAFGPGFLPAIAIVSATRWAQFARQVRAEVLSTRERDYVARARVAGASDARIMLQHILPNVGNTLVVLATLQIGTVILLESTLSFLGAGIPRPFPSWGVMVADGRELIVTAWWVSFFPGLTILLVVLSMNVFGDWLRDFLDPRLRQQV